MPNEKIKEFAIKHGFQDIKKIGIYSNSDVYVPIFYDGNARKIGYPQYILVKGDEIFLKVDTSLEMTKTLFPE